MNWFRASSPGLTKGLPLAVGSTVRMLCNPKAQVAAGRKVGGPPVVKLEMQGTRGFPGSFASAAIIGSCEAVGAKILLFVSSGTESCASDRRPSYPTKKNVASLIMGKLRVPPNCWRLKEFFTGSPAAARLKLAKVESSDRAGLKANGSRASIALLRKNP